MSVPAPARPRLRRAAAPMTAGVIAAAVLTATVPTASLATGATASTVSAAATASLVLGTDGSHTDTVPLKGAKTKSPVYVSVDSPPSDLKYVEFSIDGKVRNRDRKAPYDLGGSTTAGAGKPVTLALGGHLVTAVLQPKGTAKPVTIKARFRVTKNGGTNPGGGTDLSKTTFYGLFHEVTSVSTLPSYSKQKYGATPASAMWFDSWGAGGSFPVSEAKNLWSQGVLPHYTWEPWYTSRSVSDPTQIHLSDILAGTWDSYITARGKEFAQAGVPILVRWGHEFNGNWYPWGIANNGQDPAQYIKAYRYVHDLVVKQGATNVQWVWAFNNGSSPGESWNDPSRAYPGDTYVDWVGLDGYNWGFSPSWDPGVDHWTSFDATYGSAYRSARSIAPKKPIMIAEFACTEDGGDKASWLADMFDRFDKNTYPNLKHFVYFDEDKEEHWNLDSSTSVLSTFKKGIAAERYQADGKALAEVAKDYKPVAD